MTVIPQPRSVARLRPNAGCRARATFGQGTVTMGRPRPVASLSSPSASVSLIPAAHLLMVLKVAGAAAKALAGGKTSGASGSLKLMRTGWPVSSVTRAMSKNRTPSGVVITQVSQSAVRAEISAGSSRAGAAPDAITYSTGRRSNCASFGYPTSHHTASQSAQSDSVRRDAHGTRANRCHHELPSLHIIDIYPTGIYSHEWQSHKSAR